MRWSPIRSRYATLQRILHPRAARRMRGPIARDPADAGLAGGWHGQPARAASMATQIIQAKGARLFARSAARRAARSGRARFAGGAFATLYLAPYNYHRIHMPLTGTLQGGLVRAGQAVQRECDDGGGGRRSVRAQRTRGVRVRGRAAGVRDGAGRRAVRGQHDDGLARRHHAAPAAARRSLCRSTRCAAPRGSSRARRWDASTWAPR